jgi:hypothetical protein
MTRSKSGTGALLAPCYVKRDADDQEDYAERNEGDERFHLEPSDLFHLLINLVMQQPACEA